MDKKYLQPPKEPKQPRVGPQYQAQIPPMQRDSQPLKRQRNNTSNH